MWISAADEDAFRRLRRLRDGAPVLSLYLGLEKGLALHHGYAAAAMDTLRAAEKTVQPEWRPMFDSESERALAWLRGEFKPHGQTLLVFASKPRRLWSTISLQLALPSVARFSPRPYLPPLEAAMEDHPRTAIALVNDDSSRILTLRLDEIESEAETHSDIPGRQRQGGWAAFKYQRDRESHIHKHLVDVVGELVDLQRSRPFKRLVLGGTREATEAVAAILPGSLKQKYCGSFRMEMFRSDDDAASAGAAISEAAEREEERSLAAMAVERALAGGRAALGWEETLGCLRDGRAHQLLISEGACGSDKGDQAFELAWDSSAPIEVLHGDSVAALTPYGGIAALLRY